MSGNFAGKITLNPPTLGIGGGVFSNLGTISIANSSVIGNVATGSGGGIWNGKSAIVFNGTVTGNQAGAVGGGVFNHGNFAASLSTIAGNSPDDIFPTV